MTGVTEIKNTTEATLAFYTDSALKLEEVAAYLRLGAETDLSTAKHLLAIAADIRRDSAKCGSADQTATTLGIPNMTLFRKAG